MSDLLDLRTVIATWHLGPCAEVRVGEHVTRYVRRGSGPAVVLLGAQTETNPVWAPLVEALASNYRLVIPQPPSEEVDASAWLRGFVEGLGLSSFVLIAGGSLTTAAFELAIVDDLLVRKLVLLAGEGSPAHAMTSRVLWAAAEWSPAESLHHIEHFIASNGHRIA